MQCANPLEVLNDINDRDEIVNLRAEQEKDEDNGKVIRWKRTNVNPDLTYERRVIR